MPISPTAAPPTAAPPARSPAVPPTAGQAPSAPPKNLPPIVFLYQPKEKGAKPIEAPAVPWKLMPGKDGAKAPEQEPVPASTWDVAMKIARARAGVAALNQAQVIVKDAKAGAFLVAGIAHVAQVKGKDGKPATTAIPAMLDGAKFDAEFGAVQVAKTVEAIQAIVGAAAWIDLRKAPQGSPQPFEKAVK